MALVKLSSTMWLLLQTQFALPAPFRTAAKRGAGGRGWAPPQLTAAFWSLHELNQQLKHAAFGHSLAEREKNCRDLCWNLESFYAKHACIWLSKVSLGLTDELLVQRGLEVTKFSCLSIVFLQLGYLLQIFVLKHLKLIQRKKNYVQNDKKLLKFHMVQAQPCFRGMTILLTDSYCDWNSLEAFCGQG